VPKNDAGDTKMFGRVEILETESYRKGRAAVREGFTNLRAATSILAGPSIIALSQHIDRLFYVGPEVPVR
jgi:hypothetical protein